MTNANDDHSMPAFSLPAFSSAISALVSNAAPFVVGVVSDKSRASGFVWKSGLVVTADEALAEEGDVTIVFGDGSRAKAEVAGRDPSTDIALLRVDTRDAAPAPLTGLVPGVGALTLVVSRSGAASEAALGIVSVAGGEWRSLRGGEIAARIELGLSLRATSEGGLVIDAAGQAFGMAVFGPRRRALVIPTATIERAARLLETHGRIPRGYLGLGLQRVKVDGGEFGVMIVSVDPKGPGAAAGLRQGDIVVAWNDAPLARARTILSSLGSSSVGVSIKLSLMRAGEPVESRLTIAERPRD